jgi:hypothetical protein
MTETAPAAPAAKLMPLSPAERMRLTRERRRRGLRLLAVELRESEIDALVRRGRLAPQDRASPAAIKKALYGFLNDHLTGAGAPSFRATAPPRSGI